MDPKDFDDILKNKLEGLNSTSTAVPNWERMERDLDVDSQKDQIFDEQVKRKLEQISVSKYASSNWSTLYQLVNNRIIKKRAVLFSKAAEFSIFALFLLGFSQLGWFDEYKDQVHFASAFEQINQVETAKTFDVSQQGKEEMASAKISNQLELGNSTHESNRVVSVTTVNPRIESINLATAIVADRIVEEDTAPALRTEESTAGMRSVSAEFSAITPRVLVNPVADDLIAVKEPQLLYASSDLNLSPVLIENTLKGNMTRFYGEVGVDMAYASINSALRSTGSRNDFEIQQTTNKLYPVSYVKAGVDFGRLSVNSGVEYQSIAYDPNVNHLSGEVSGIITNSDIDELKYDVVAIPLNVAWKLASYKTWDVKVNAGVVCNFITNTSYQVSQQKSSGDRVTPVPANNVDFTALPPLPSGYFDEPRNDRFVTSMLYASKNYFQSRTGIEVSKRVNKKTSIIANMNYNYQLPTFNVGTQDAINNYTIGLSVRRYFS